MFPWLNNHGSIEATHSGSPDQKVVKFPWLNNHGSIEIYLCKHNHENGFLWMFLEDLILLISQENRRRKNEWRKGSNTYWQLLFEKGSAESHGRHLQTWL